MDLEIGILFIAARILNEHDLNSLPPPLEEPIGNFSPAYVLIPSVPARGGLQPEELYWHSH